MVPISTTISCIITLMISLILPIVVIIIFSARNKKQGLFSAWILGAAGFFIPQFLIRLPIITVLSRQSWFDAFSKNNLFLYAFSLAFTAGLFELAGRFVVAKIIRKKMTWTRSLAVGLGHGGIEAIIITGVTYINNIIYIVMINSGTLFTAIGSDAPQEIIAQLQNIQTALFNTSPAIFLLAGFERILAMTSHLAMSVIVCRGVYSGNIGKATLMCLGIHTLIDLTAGISLLIGTALTQTVAYIIIYAILSIVAVLSLWILYRINCLWKNEALCGDS